MAGLFAVFSTAIGLSAADAVIMADGFVIQGRWFKETELVIDGPGRPIRVAKANGFDVIDDGPKFIVFSTHAQKGGKLEKDLARPDFASYKRAIGNPRNPLPNDADRINKITPFDADWKRTTEFHIAGGGYEIVRQQILHLDPYFMMIASSTHFWRIAYHTAERDVKEIRQLLSTHPDLKDPAGKVDPSRRLNIISFLKEVGTHDPTRRSVNWYLAAREEMDKLKKDLPGDWDKDSTERFEKLGKELDQAESKWAVDELEAAVESGRYDFATRLLSGFTPKGLNDKDTIRLANVKAQVETVRPKYETTVRLLENIVREVGGTIDPSPFAAVGGPAIAPMVPRKNVPPGNQALADAGSAILSELHPDSARRIELFLAVAQQAEKDALAGKPATKKPEDMLALAVTGWLRGKNGAEPNPEAAVKCWLTRQMALGYLRESIGNNRKEKLDAYLKSGKPFGPEELAQIITLLPPPFAEDPRNPTGKKIPKEETGGVEGITLRNTGPLPGTASGFDYVLRLPPEYHHGRSYPVILALTSPGAPAEEMVGALAEYADRHGYIVAAPQWAGSAFKLQPYDYSGKDHVAATSVLRDLMRRYQVDPDKVFLLGLGEGANFAIDLSMAHPDLFAGQIAMNPNPPTNIFMEYWRNIQKVPTYVVIGELSGTFSNLRRVYEKWVTRGFPAIMTVYKGRQAEWYRVELPRIFDWMGRKTRARGTATLRLNQTGFEPWQVVREADDRYYWVGVGEGGLRNPNMIAKWTEGKSVTPAQFRADIGRNGTITIDQAIGIRKFVIWLERDLIDWSKPVNVSVNGQRPINFRPKVLTPDLGLMFEELYRTGDRKMLFMGKLEVEGPG